ncbi:MAG: polyphosphate kinase [Pseudoalteromonas tetraodonis]|jgi:polyphosphate kinase
MTEISDTEDVLNLDNPEYFASRELSLLEFNRRVLSQAYDEQIPLLERLRYLCISTSNMDEFFEVRVAGLKQRDEHGVGAIGADQKTPHELLAEITVVAHDIVDEQYHVFNDVLCPQLEEEGIFFRRRSEWTTEQAAWLRQFYEDQLQPILSPMGLDPAHPFPRILNKSLNFIISLEGKDAFGRNSGYAVLQAPRALPRIIRLPDEVANEANEFVFLSSVIHAFVSELFPGMHTLGCYQFRVTRNSDLFVDEEEVDDLLRALEGQLPGRRYGDEVRLEMADDVPDEMVEFLINQFELKEVDFYRVNGPVNLGRLAEVIDSVDKPELKFKGYTPALSSKLGTGGRILEQIRKKDILLHHPYDSFLPVIEFIKQAADDPQVLVIKQTLYRTDADSAIADALVRAAKSGKEVTVVVELRARFEEEGNIKLANRLQAAGAHVVYGVVGYKTHAKMAMVLRREDSDLTHYVHLGTGNYHSRTARVYTDFGLFTADPQIGQDVHRMFLQLTSLGKGTKLKALWQAPFTLYNNIIDAIDREAANAREGKPARVIAKLNQLTDSGVIKALYRASQAGVQIDLIVRGMCCVKVGIPGVSENIRLRSIIGRFLEHHRVYHFHNSGQDDIWLSSADWMERNLHRRVESCFPIKNTKLHAKILAMLELYLQDNQAAWLLETNGSYKRVVMQEGDEAVSAQSHFLQAVTG